MSVAIKYGQWIAIVGLVVCATRVMRLGLVSMERRQTTFGYFILLASALNASLCFFSALGIYRWNRIGRKWILAWIVCGFLQSMVLTSKTAPVDWVRLLVFAFIFIWLCLPTVRSRFEGKAPVTV